MNKYRNRISLSVNIMEKALISAGFLTSAGGEPHGIARMHIWRLPWG